MSFYFCAGKYARPRMEINNGLVLFRVCLGRVAFAVIRFDVEELFAAISEEC